MRLFTLIVLACSLASVVAHAAAPKPGDWVYDETAKVLDEAADRDLRDPAETRADGSRAPDAWGTPPPRMFTRIDVNHDGFDDWRVNYEFAPNPSLWCGTGGCRNDVWVSEPGHHEDLHMSLGVRDFKLSRKGGVTRLDLDFHGTVCGGYGVQECPRSYLWTEGGFVETPVRGQTWLYGGPVSLAPARLNDMPNAGMAVLERLQMQCGINNGKFDTAWGVQSIPDVDGDGYRDWIVGSAYASCDYGPERANEASPALPVAVIVSGGNLPDGRVAYEGEKLTFGLDIGGETATLYAVPEGTECEYQKPCGKRLRWDEASGRLVE